MSLDFTSVPAKWHLNPPGSSSRVHVCVRQTDDRQTDYATEKCVGVGGIASSARAIPPKRLNRRSISRATERHLPYEITPRYLPPDTGERAQQADTRLTYPEGWKAELTWVVGHYQDALCGHPLPTSAKNWTRGLQLADIPPPQSATLRLHPIAGKLLPISRPAEGRRLS